MILLNTGSSEEKNNLFILVQMIATEIEFKSSKCIFFIVSGKFLKDNFFILYTYVYILSCICIMHICMYLHVYVFNSVINLQQEDHRPLY